MTVSVSATHFYRYDLLMLVSLELLLGLREAPRLIYGYF